MKLSLTAHVILMSGSFLYLRSRVASGRIPEGACRSLFLASVWIVEGGRGKLKAGCLPPHPQPERERSGQCSQSEGRSPKGRFFVRVHQGGDQYCGGGSRRSHMHHRRRPRPLHTKFTSSSSSSAPTGHSCAKSHNLRRIAQFQIFLG